MTSTAVALLLIVVAIQAAVLVALQIQVRALRKTEVYFPGLSDWGRQRLQINAAVKRELWKNFFIGLNMFETFDSRPPSPGANRNDVGVVMSIRWSY